MLDKKDITIGRTADNDITIDNLAVSSHHATVHDVNEGAVVEDMGSTNGTFVNDNKVTRHTLKDGDIITVGGMVTKINEKITKNENRMAFIEIEDFGIGIPMIWCIGIRRHILNLGRFARSFLSPPLPWWHRIWLCP